MRFKFNLAAPPLIHVGFRLDTGNKLNKPNFAKIRRILQGGDYNTSQVALYNTHHPVISLRHNPLLHPALKNLGKIFGKIWEIWKIWGNFWKNLGNLGKSWKFLGKFGKKSKKKSISTRGE